MCLSNFKAVRLFKVPISWLRDFTRSYEKTFFRILRRGPASVDFSVARPIFKWVAKTWLQDCSLHNDGHTTRSIEGTTPPVFIDWGVECLTDRSRHVATLCRATPGPWFNIKMISYQYRKSHCGDKTILRPSYLHNGISYTGKMSSLYWIRAQICVDQLDHDSCRCSGTYFVLAPNRCQGISNKTIDCGYGVHELYYVTRNSLRSL